MNDEDIQYLGTRSPLSTGPLTPGRQQRDFVSGFILHVEKSANESENKLTFWRSDHSVIHIGRRPANPTPADSVGSSDNAMFRCAVVSRKHAKIVFSDSGTVYIVDTNSHHGTHILKADSTSAASKQIPSETPTQLSNGDIITFGKTVGRSNEFVTPIVIRVELMYAPPLFSRPVGTTTPMRQTSNQDKTIDLTLLNTPPPTISPLFRRPPTAIPSPIPMRRTGSNSGRYGLNLDLSPLEISSASSSESDDSEDRGGERDMSPDSDIEELPSSSSIAMHHNSTPASGPNALPILRPRVPSFGSGRSLDDALESIAQAEVAPAPAPEESHSRIHRAFEIFEVLKNLIPPVNIPGVGPSTELAAPPSPPHELMARQRTMNESSHDDVADESIQQAQQLSLDASLYRPHTPISQASSSSSLAPLKLHIEPISRPAGPDFPRNSEQQGPMFDLFDAPGSPLEASPICSFSPYSPRSLSNNLPSPPLQPSISPMHTPPPDFLNPSCLGSLQPDSIFTQGFLDKEKQRQRDLARDIVEEQSQRIHPWTFTPSPISRSPSPDMRDGEYERFEDPDADFVPFPCVSEIAFFGDFSSQASNASSRLSYEDNTHGEVVQEKEREGSPMELESVDGENLHAMPARDVSSEAANKAQKRLTLSERLRLEREELERRLKTFRRITTDEDIEQDVVPEAAPEQEGQEEEAPVSSCVEVPVAAPSLTPNKAMSLDSICSSDVAAIPPAQAPAAEPVREEPAGFPEVDALKGQIRQLQDDIQKAQTQQRRTKARVARSLRVQSERVTDLDDKVDDVVKQCLSVTEKVDNVMDTDMPDLVGQVEQLREMLESKTSAALQDVLEKNHDGLEKERKDIMEHVEMLKSLVDEMRELKEYSEEQMKAELDAIRLAKEEAIKTIAAHVEAQLALTPSPASITASTTTMQPVSLKRKRNDDGEDDEGGENEAGDEGVSVDDDEMNDEEEHGSLFQAPTLIPDYELPQPPRKRIRRVAATAAKTATAVTVGAIAAWSALAFT